MPKKSILLSIFILILFLSAELILRLYGWRQEPTIYEEISDPIIRWVHTAGFEGRVNNTNIKISSQRLRDREYSFDKPRDTFRIIAVGECTVFGRDVELEESFVKQLEAMLNDRNPFVNFKHYEVINAGVALYEDLQKVGFLKKYGLRYHPDLIIFGHDLSFRAWIEPRFTLRWFRLIWKRIPKQIYSIRYLFSRIAEIVDGVWERGNVMRRDEESFIKYRYAGAGSRYLKTDRAFKELASISQDRHIPVTVVFFPWLDKLAEDKYLFKWIHQLYKEKCIENNFTFLDLYEVYFKNKEAKSFWIDERYRHHPNALAHKITANEVYRELTSQRYLMQE